MSEKSNLTAWERWELASFDGTDTPGSTSANASGAVPPEPTYSAVEILALRESARSEAHAEGKKAGYDAGYGEGLVKGQAAAEAVGRKETDKLTAVISKFETQLNELDASVADELTALALEVARQILRQTLDVKPETIVGVVHDALAQLPVQHAIIHLHPDDASLARSYAGDQLTHIGHRIQENRKLARGDVVIESGGSHLDASMSTRWRRVVEALGKDTPWVVADETDDGAT